MRCVPDCVLAGSEAEMPSVKQRQPTVINREKKASLQLRFLPPTFSLIPCHRAMTIKSFFPFLLPLPPPCSPWRRKRRSKKGNPKQEEEAMTYWFNTDHRPPSHTKHLFFPLLFLTPTTTIAPHKTEAETFLFPQTKRFSFFLSCNTASSTAERKKSLRHTHMLATFRGIDKRYFFPRHAMDSSAQFISKIETASISSMAKKEMS